MRLRQGPTGFVQGGRRGRRLGGGQLSEERRGLMLPKARAIASWARQGGVSGARKLDYTKYNMDDSKTKQSVSSREERVGKRVEVKTDQEFKTRSRSRRCRIELRAEGTTTAEV
jgi:hypothetical protein